MNIFIALQYASFIGRGPATLGPAGRAFAFVLGIVFGIAAVSTETRFGGAFSRGKNPSELANTIGRLLLIVVAVVMFALALGLLH